jgi:signal transduction histidine kinase
MVILAGALVGGAHRFRVRRLERRERELEALVAERTRRLEEEKARAEEATARAEAANNLKSELIAVTAHDLKNPLQVASGFAEVLAAQVPPGSPAAEMTAAIQRAAERMLALIEALLTHAALEAGALELRRQVLDLAVVAAAVVEQNRPHAERKRQRLEITSAGPAFVSADATRLTQVLDNLVSNAVKYSPPGATVRLVLASAEGRSRVAVRDEGPGLTAEDMAGLFRRFHKLSARPTGGEGSTGLGLSIVRRLVDLHGGRVWAESAGPGRGSTFVVELPAA